MSFSLKVKNELAAEVPNSRHCRIAELAALVSLSSTVEDGCIVIRTENSGINERFVLLYGKLTGAERKPVPETIIRKNGRKSSYITAMDREGTAELIKLLKLGPELVPQPIVYQQTCCKRAFLRGAFISCGSISNPEKDYHLEFAAADRTRAELIAGIIGFFEIDAKIIHRKNHFVVYLKDGEHIVDVLNIMEAHVCLMELENVRIVKEMRNSINRRVNCEAANIGKTIAASARQIEDIQYLCNTIGLDSLSDELKVTATLRLQYPEASLAELGEKHERRVGRSGVNHRLQKLSEIAEKLRSARSAK